MFLDDSSSEVARKEALKLLIHFIGDLQQPLHVETAACGGKDIEPVRFDGDLKDTSLT